MGNPFSGLAGSGIQLFQNSRKIIYICFQRDDLRLDFRILECLFLFDRFKMVVGIALHLERLLYQTAGVCIRGKHIGFDDELSAIPIFGYYILGNIAAEAVTVSIQKSASRIATFFIPYTTSLSRAPGPVRGLRWQAQPK